MRITWIILIIMLVAGAGMYFLSTIKSAPGVYDTVAIENTVDSVMKKVKVFVANDPAEIYYLDGVWMKPDSIPLKKVLDGSKLSFMNKGYNSITLFFTWGDRFFYDLEIQKPDTTLAYQVEFSVRSQNDSVYVDGSIDKKDDVIHFAGPMMPLYKQFVLTYNNKMPPLPPDSTAIGDTAEAADEPKGPQPNKTITVLQN